MIEVGSDNYWSQLSRAKNAMDHPTKPGQLGSEILPIHAVVSATIHEYASSPKETTAITNEDWQNKAWKNQEQAVKKLHVSEEDECVKPVRPDNFMVLSSCQGFLGGFFIRSWCFPWVLS